MKVTTAYPVIIDKERKSYPEWYLNANGKRVRKRAGKGKPASAPASAPVGSAKKETTKPKADKPMGGAKVRTRARVQGGKNVTSFGGMKVTTMYPVIIDKQRKSYPEWYLNMDGKNKQEVMAFQDWLDSKGYKWVNGKALNKGYGYGNYGTSTTKAYAKYGSDYEKSLVKPTPAVGKATQTTTKEPTAETQKQMKEKGLFWNKLKGGWVQADEIGLIDKLAGWVGLTPSNQGGGGEVIVPEEQPEGKGMGTGTMVLIGLGVVALLGVVYYMSKSPKTASK